MHFFKNSVSFIAVMCVCTAAAAAVVASSSSRVGVVSAASRRLPSLSNIAKASGTTTTTTTTSSTGTGLISDTDCIDDYRACMKSDTACGSDFEECTTNVLFHGHMGECFSTLYQCSPAAIERLFGTSNLNALSDGKQYVDGTVKKDVNGNIVDGEIARFAYPTDGSVMGVDIIGAATRNKLDTADCVKKYKRCLNKDNVCGEDFELCTSDTEFKKQAAMCDSTLARCQKEGFQQLFGEEVTTKPSNKRLSNYAGGDIEQWIADGAALAAANAVNTCYKVVDNCFANACAKNPYSCVEGVKLGVVSSANLVDGEEIVPSTDVSVDATQQTATDVRKFFRAACQDTIGSNQYCYMTFNEGKKPSQADLKDEDYRADVFDEAYNTRKNIVNTKVQELVKNFDTTARNKCIETFKSCAKQSCGGGSGAACYAKVFSAGSGRPIMGAAAGRTFTPNSSISGSINGVKTYADIENGCAAIVNTDANCKYMAATMVSDNTYNYTFSDDGAFGTLFPKTGTSPVVAALNADLSTSYNDAAIAQMKKQCQTVAANCVKSMCGTDYQNCYRNRNDIALNTYDTTSDSFNRSMNKVGGVLDYTIVQGLCMSTVKSADACAESLAIARATMADDESTAAGWGTNTTVGGAWNTSANQNYNQEVQETDPNTGKKLCDCDNGDKQICDYEDGGVTGCSTPHMISQSIAQENWAVDTVFKEILVDVEREAQAKYNAKLTHEQNICLAQNSAANPDATFVWAKLKGKMKSDYSAHGLGDNGSVPSNDLYNSFCRVKVILKSEDKDIETLLSGGKITVTEQRDGLFGIDGLARDKTSSVGSGQNESSAYFAVGDPFTCGAWVSDKTLDAVSQKVAANARKEAGQGSIADRNVKLWTTLGVGTLGSVGSYIGMNALQTNGKSLGGLLKKTSSATASDNEREQARLCRAEYNNAKSAADEAKNAVDEAKSAATAASNETATTKLTDTQTTANNKAQIAKNKVETAVKAARDMIAYAAKSGVGTSYVKTNFSTTSTSIGTKDSVPQSVALYSVSDMETLLANLKTLDEDCGKREKDEETDEDRKSRMTNNLVAAGVGGVATTLLANGIVSSAQKAKYETAANDAVQEWMNSIGSKIHCYVGGQLVGDFGDIVSVDISEE